MTGKEKEEVMKNIQTNNAQIDGLKSQIEEIEKQKLEIQQKIEIVKDAKK
ncbi:MAG: hypothetical protein LBV67_10495 [Streptococcaceae bacterium]|jgi:prefoldin subunit 5|nr:hypothetical protein [Streptococcaceae bacterium]